MGTARVQFARQYRAALFDFMLGSGEGGRERAYALGRIATDTGVGLLQVVRVHQDAVRTLIESMHVTAECVRRVQSADDFLLEALGPFEMMSRGYVEALRPPERR